MRTISERRAAEHPCCRKHRPAGRCGRQASPARRPPEHRLLQRLLPLRRIPRRSKKAERQNALRLHGRQCVEHSSSCTPASFMLRRLRSSASAPSFCSASSRSQCARLSPPPERATSQVSGVNKFPSIRRLHNPAWSASFGFAWQRNSTSRRRTSACTVVLGQCILVELGERGSQALLHLARERSTAVRPVDRHELRQFVGTLDDPRERLRDQARWLA